MVVVTLWGNSKASVCGPTGGKEVVALAAPCGFRVGKPLRLAPTRTIHELRKGFGHVR